MILITTERSCETLVLSKHKQSPLGKLIDILAVGMMPLEWLSRYCHLIERKTPRKGMKQGAAAQIMYANLRSCAGMTRNFKRRKSNGRVRGRLCLTPFQIEPSALDQEVR